MQTLQTIIGTPTAAELVLTAVFAVLSGMLTHAAWQTPRKEVSVRIDGRSKDRSRRGTRAR